MTGLFFFCIVILNMSQVFEGGATIDTLISGNGINTRLTIRCATTNTININTNLQPGGIIDGVTLVTDDRVLVKNQSTQYEITVVTTVADAAGSLSGKYFLINSINYGYYVWFNMDNMSTNPNALSSQLQNSGRIGIQVNYSANDLATTIAANLTTAINMVSSQFTAVNTGGPSNIVTITNVAAGYVSAATDGLFPTGFGFSITAGGTSTIDNGLWICDTNPYRAYDLTTGAPANHIFVHIAEGTVNQNTAWVCTNISGSDIVGTSPLNWTQYAAYNYNKGDIYVGGPLNNLVKVPQPTQYSLLQIDDTGNVSWTAKDDVQAGIDPKASVRFGTTAALTGAGWTYISTGGSSGTGAFSNVDLTVTGSLDLNGNTVAIDDRILIKNQIDAKQNGIYVVLSTGTTGSLQRAPDQDGVNPASNISGGNFTFVELGNTLAQTGWITQGSGILAVNVNPINWVQFNGSFGITSGRGITVASNKVSVKPDTTTVDTTIAGVSSLLDTAVLSVVSSSTTGQTLLSSGIAGNSANWGALDLTNNNAVSGALPVNNGGTGLNQAAYTNGSMLYYDNTISTTQLQKLAKPLVNSTLTFPVSGNTPVWTTNVYADTLVSPSTGLTEATFSAPVGSVNNLQFTANVAGSSPTITSIGSDTNIGIDFQAKGTGMYNFLGTTSTSASVKWYEQTTNGTNYIGLASPANVTSNQTWTLPIGPPTNGYFLKTDGSGNWSFANPASTFSRGYTIQSSVVAVTSSGMYRPIGYFAWDNTLYGSASNARIVFYAKGTASSGGSRNILIQVVNSIGSVIGGPATISTDGINTLTFTNPIANDYISVQVKKSGAGGSIPSIYGIQLELN